MAHPEQPSRCFRFGPFVVDVQSRELLKRGEPVTLQSKPFQLLVALVENPGQVVARDELQRKLWPQDTFVDFDNGLNTAIAKLREALGESAGQRHYIETLPGRGYRFIAPVSSSDPAHRTMLAVLPFENLSGDPSQEYFSDGLTEETITHLARLSPEQLGVIGRVSAMRYKHRRTDLAKVARELGVQYVLEGSTRREARRVRITAQLISTADQSHVWAQSYDRDSDDILDVQSNVAESVAREVGIRLDPKHTVMPTVHPPTPKHFDSLLKARYYISKLSKQGLDKGLEYVNEILADDPDYAAAQEVLAYYHLIASEWLAAPSQAMPAAKTAGLRALQLDEHSAEALIVLGIVNYAYDWNWPAAEKEFQKAITLNPNLARAYEHYGIFLSTRGRVDEAIAMETRALELEPLSLEISTVLGEVLYFGRRYDNAVQHLRETLELDANYWFARLNMGFALEQKGDLSGALAEAQRAKEIENTIPEAAAAVAYLYAKLGEKARAKRLLDEFSNRAISSYVSAYSVAKVYAALGDASRTFQYLEQAFQQRSFGLTRLQVDPGWDNLRGNPQFQSFLQQMKFES